MEVFFVFFCFILLSLSPPKICDLKWLAEVQCNCMVDREKFVEFNGLFWFFVTPRDLAKLPRSIFPIACRGPKPARTMDTRCCSTSSPSTTATTTKDPKASRWPWCITWTCQLCVRPASTSLQERKIKLPSLRPWLWPRPTPCTGSHLPSGIAIPRTRSASSICLGIMAIDTKWATVSSKVHSRTYSGNVNAFQVSKSKLKLVFPVALSLF